MLKLERSSDRERTTIRLIGRARSEHLDEITKQMGSCGPEVTSLLQSGAIKPIVAKTFPLAEATDALRYLVEGRPSGGLSSQSEML